MNKNLKTILIIIVVVAVVGIIVFFLVDSKSLSSLVAVITAGWATFKAKLFGSTKSADSIIREHTETRQNWDALKSEYDSNINALKARMDYIDYRSAKISALINDLKQEEKEKIDAFNKMNDKEKEDFVNNLLNP